MNFKEMFIDLKNERVLPAKGIITLGKKSVDKDVSAFNGRGASVEILIDNKLAYRVGLRIYPKDYSLEIYYDGQKTSGDKRGKVPYTAKIKPLYDSISNLVKPWADELVSQEKTN